MKCPSNLKEPPLRQQERQVASAAQQIWQQGWAQDIQVARRRILSPYYVRPICHASNMNDQERIQDSFIVAPGTEQIAHCLFLPPGVIGDIYRGFPSDHPSRALSPVAPRLIEGARLIEGTLAVGISHRQALE